MEEMPKVSIVAAYYNRKDLLENTIRSIVSSQHYKEAELVVVDDGSDPHHRLEDLVEESPLHMNLIRIEPEEKKYTNPCIPFNRGFKEARGEIVIIQNPECFHVGDIIGEVLKEITDDNYLSFAAYSLGEEETKGIATEKDIELFGEASRTGGGRGWYNHSIINPRPYHFLSAISRKNLEELGGFDERYAEGIGFDDDELLHRIKQKGLDVKIVDFPFVLHQWHYGEDSFEMKSIVENEKFRFNYNLYHDMTSKSKEWKVNIA